MTADLATRLREKCPYCEPCSDAKREAADAVDSLTAERDLARRAWAEASASADIWEKWCMDSEVRLGREITRREVAWARLAAAEAERDNAPHVATRILEQLAAAELVVEAAKAFGNMKFSAHARGLDVIEAYVPLAAAIRSYRKAYTADPAAPLRNQGLTASVPSPEAQGRDSSDLNSAATDRLQEPNGNARLQNLNTGSQPTPTTERGGGSEPPDLNFSDRAKEDK